MTVVVRFFARARDLAGMERMSLEVGPGARVREVRQQLAVALPQLATLLERSALAIGEDFVGDEAPVQEGQEIAVLPPVSGGGVQ